MEMILCDSNLQGSTSSSAFYWESKLYFNFNYSSTDVLLLSLKTASIFSKQSFNFLLVGYAASLFHNISPQVDSSASTSRPLKVFDGNLWYLVWMSTPLQLVSQSYASSLWNSKLSLWAWISWESFELTFPHLLFVVTQLQIHSLPNFTVISLQSQAS